MPKRKLTLPTSYSHQDLKLYFSPSKQSNNSNNNSVPVEASDTESDIESSYYQPSTPISSFNRITKRIEEESTNENGLTLSQELERDLGSEKSTPDTYKRLHKHYDVNDNNASPPVSSEEESVSESDYPSDEGPANNAGQVDLTNEDNYADDEVEFVEEENKRLRDNGWLQRVTTHLLPQSQYQPSQADRTNYGKIFLELKKEWGYKVGNFRTLNQGECAICGHSPVASLFKIRNIYTQQKTETGSTCITQFRVLDRNNLFYSKGQSLRMIKDDISYANSERNAETSFARRFIWS